MKEDRFVRENTETWKTMESTVKKLKAKSFHKLGKAELDSLLPLYNQVCSDLSYSRTFFGNTSTTEYLNRLVASAHSIIYTTGTGNIKKLLTFYTRKFPALVRKKAVIFLVSFALFFAGFLASFIFTAVNPDNATAFIPEQIVEGMDLDNQNRDGWNSPIQSTFILTNNIKVGFSAFALGITLGLGTLYILWTNGAMLGGIAALAFTRGQSYIFWSLILPHGIIELFSIFICGTAGIILGWSLISPGELSRKDSLILRGRESMELVAGTIPLFVIAGLIEGFVTPAKIPEAAKYAVAAVSLILLVFYLFFLKFFKKATD